MKWMPIPPAPETEHEFVVQNRDGYAVKTKANANANTKAKANANANAKAKTKTKSTWKSKPEPIARILPTTPNPEMSGERRFDFWPARRTGLHALK